MNKKGVNFKEAFFAIVGFSLFIIAIGVMITNYSEQYGTSINNDLGQYDKLEEISSQATGQKESIGSNDPDPSEDAEANTFRGVYGILTNLYSSFDLVFGTDGMLQSASDQFGIPSYIIRAIITFMMIGITFSLIAIIFRLARGSA